tara:strand:- start:232 stop:405 length:174 start_codon:yes stop_codon:yes gene_type:complete
VDFLLFLGEVFHPKNIELKLFNRWFRILLTKLKNDFIDKDFKFDPPTTILSSTKIKK